MDSSNYDNQKQGEFAIPQLRSIPSPYTSLESEGSQTGSNDSYDSSKNNSLNEDQATGNAAGGYGGPRDFSNSGLRSGEALKKLGEQSSERPEVGAKQGGLKEEW